MIELIEANWIAFGAVFLLGLLVAWWVWGRGKSAGQRREVHDVLSEGAAPAQRNSALIDAPPAASLASVTPFAGTGAMAGMGEVIAAAATQEIADAAPEAPAPAGAGDDLRKIKGVGPKLVARLAELGISRFAQIAAWTPADIAAIDAQLGTFAGRIERDNWVEQCGYLASDDVTGFEARFGKV